jgi:hypothetical protein
MVRAKDLYETTTVVSGESQLRSRESRTRSSHGKYMKVQGLEWSMSSVNCED